MKLHFATVPVQDSDAAARELNAFLASHRIVGVERHLVADGAQSVWAFCVTYTERNMAAAHVATSNGAEMSSAKRGRVDFKELLNEREFAAFVQLRETRKHIAQREGVPPYPVLSRLWGVA